MEGRRKGHVQYTLVKQICDMEDARRIAVREGFLSILVGWIKSMDPENIRLATSALRHLTSIKVKYMAGWIYSQMVNEGSLQVVVTLTHKNDRGVGHDVELAVAQILSSLCVAPHTRGYQRSYLPVNWITIRPFEYTSSLACNGVG